MRKGMGKNGEVHAQERMRGAQNNEKERMSMMRHS